MKPSARRNSKKKLSRFPISGLELRRWLAVWLTVIQSCCWFHQRVGARKSRVHNHPNQKVGKRRKCLFPGSIRSTIAPSKGKIRVICLVRLPRPRETMSNKIHLRPRFSKKIFQNDNSESDQKKRRGASIVKTRESTEWEGERHRKTIAKKPTLGENIDLPSR